MALCAFSVQMSVKLAFFVRFSQSFGFVVMFDIRQVETSSRVRSFSVQRSCRLKMLLN